MRFLFLSNEFPNQIDPFKATFNLDLLRALSKDHDVDVIAPIAWTDRLRARLRGRAVGGNLPYSLEGMTVRHPNYYFTPLIMRNYYSQFLEWSLRSSLEVYEKKTEVDCVLSYWAHPDGDVAASLAKRLNRPSMVMVGGSDVLLLTRDPSRRKCVHRALSKADAVLAVSEDIAEKVAELGIMERKIHVVRRGVDTACFSPGHQAEARRVLGLAQKHKMLLWVGRMVPVKGVEVLIRALARLQSSLPDLQLYLIGDGPERPQIESEVVRLNLQSQVKFVGSVEHLRLAHWYRASDAVVLPSFSEGVPNVLLESLACGRPFIASRVGGIPEIGEHSAARLVTPGDSVQFAQAIEELLQIQPSVPNTARPRTLEDTAATIATLAEELHTKSQGTKRNPIPVSSHSVHSASSMASLL